MGKIIRRRFDLPAVNTSGGQVRGEFELDKFVKAVKGIQLTANRDEQLFHRGFVGLLLNGEEVIPAGYHAKLLMSGLGVAPDHRYLSLNLEPGNRIMKVNLEDVNHPALPFSAYQVSVYLEMELDDEIPE